LIGHGPVGALRRLKLKFTRAGYVIDVGLGYRTYRAWFPWQVASEVAVDFRPDVVIAQSGFPAKIAKAFRDLKIPVVIHFHNVEDDDLVGVHCGCADAYISNSYYTEKRIFAKFSISSSVIVPSFRKENYCVQAKGHYITFINPHPKKGVDLMMQIAESLPQFNFLFVRSWTLEKENEERLQNFRRSMKNVVVEGPVRDIRSVYRKTRILVLPSTWEEAWGRVATEAQFSGIPVVGSGRGGIPEAIGPGGIVMARECAVTDWSRVLQKMMNDDTYYNNMSDLAFKHSKRSEIDFDDQIKEFLKIFASII
jgi:glycosyltransferase involved in cell wall biosynthesis